MRRYAGRRHFRIFVFVIFILIIIHLEPYLSPLFSGKADITGFATSLPAETVPGTSFRQAAENISKDISVFTIQLPAEIGKPVSWKKQISLKNPSNFTIELPVISENISIRKLVSGEKEEITLTNKTIIIKKPEKIEIEINDTSIEYEIEYETPAPELIEEKISDTHKRFIIKSPANISYENVLSFMSIPDGSIKIRDASKIKLYWRETKTYIQPKVYDTNNNGLIDYVEWVVPHLSEQTYDIILITKAEHLDANKNFISDISEQVKYQDGIWSETINSEEYVRATFEVALTATDDITIFPRIISGNPVVRVYEFNDTKVLAEFTNLVSNDRNTIYLNALQNSQNTFDLQVTGGSIELDQIIDPTLTISGSTELCGDVNTYTKIEVLSTGILQICARNATAGTGRVNISLGNNGNFTMVSGGLVNGTSRGGAGGAGCLASGCTSTQGEDGQTWTTGAAATTPNNGGGGGSKRKLAGDGAGGAGGGFGGTGGNGSYSAAGVRGDGGLTYNGGLVLFGGSGGGGGAGDAAFQGGAGGAGFKVNARQGVINIQGTINVTGNKGQDTTAAADMGAGGGGSGGHVILITKTLNLDNGKIVADGSGGGKGAAGSTDTCGGGGGGGGRIHYFYGTISNTSTTNTATGGAAGANGDATCTGPSAGLDGTVTYVPGSTYLPVTGYSFVLESDLSVDVTMELQYGVKNVLVNETATNLFVARFVTDFSKSETINVTGLIANSSAADRKSVLYRAGGYPGNITRRDLFIPIPDNELSAYVCPVAQSLADVNGSCTSGYSTVPDKTVSIAGQDYLVLEGVDGTGGLAGDQWPMFHHDLRHTGYINISGPATANLIWNYTTGGIVSSSPAIANGIVYIGSYNDQVYALNANNGTKIWNYTTGGDVESSPAIASGIVYVGSNDYQVYALNASNGTKIWNYTTSDTLRYSSPAIASGIVYVGSNDYQVYALNASNGTKIWNYTTEYFVTSVPAIANGIVYIGASGNVYALNASNGTKIWNYDTATMSYSSPAIANGIVYFGAGNAEVYALNASNGTKIWNYTTAGSVESSPAIASGIVYVGSNDNQVYALNANNGTKIWNYTTGGDVKSSPAIASGIVYVGSNDRQVYALNANNGTKIWNYTTINQVWSSPALAVLNSSTNILVVGSAGNGPVYAFAYPAPAPAPDTQAPGWSDPLRNVTNVLQNTYVKFNASWTDDFGLSYYIFSINQSNVWVNSSPVAFSNGESFNISYITAATGTNVSWRFYANDTSNNWNQTTIQSFVVASAADTTPPEWTNQSQSAENVSMLGTIYLWAYGKDETNLTQAWLATNETGSWMNWTGTNTKYGSPITIISPANTWNLTNFTWSNSTIQGNTIVYWKIYYNDSSGNINETDVKNFTVLPTISISTIVSTVAFGQLNPEVLDDTDDNNPPPFVIRNDGNFNANVTIGATDLFPSAPNPSPYYRFKSAENEAGSVVNTTTDLVLFYIFMYPSFTPIKLVTNFKWQDANDEVKAGIQIFIPATEAAGNKTSDVTFTGSQA